MTPEASIRERHVVQQQGVTGGYGGILTCSCGARWSDPDLDCPTLESELDALHHARFDDDGGPAR